MPSGPPLRVVIAGGGTGGHVEPALNLADELRRRDPSTDIVMLGTSRGLEVTLVPQRGYELELIPPVPLPRKINRDLFSVPLRLRRAVRSTRTIIERVEADVVVGFGGYVSLPAYFAARRTGTPLVIHEANARPGLANRVGARLTSFVAENYAGSLPHATRLGCPLRPLIAELDRPAARAEGRELFGLPADGPVLLVFGGSQGARSINRALAVALPQLASAGVQVLHAIGPRQEAMAEVPGYHPVAFIDRMDLAYAAADLAICRAGAMTCAEASAVGLPCVYVPYPVGNGEQRFNAQPVVNAGGGVLVDDADLTGSLLARLSLELLTDPPRLASMGMKAGAYGIPDGASRLADLVLRAASA